MSTATIESRVADLERTIYGCRCSVNQNMLPINTPRVLEELTDRACKQGIWDKKTLSEFTDWVRGLYPELYSKKSA